MSERLDAYRLKRDFAATAEPAGSRGDQGGTHPRFVVQEHHATRLHWDLRLEHDGVLVSWAVPNGIPEDPRENRKAVPTEDHPLEYIDFEGEIPAGQYGAGTMRVWDSGTYVAEKWEPGKIVVRLEGERLRGRYALFGTGEGRDWMVHRMDPPLDPRREPMPERVVPMLARLGGLPSAEAGWSYEIKWDGVRAIAYCQPGRLRLESRNLNDISARYPELRGITRALGSRAAVLDGEVVAFDEQGLPSFERLQGRMHLASDSAVRRRMTAVPVTYVAFDLLYLDGHVLMALPYSERRKRLESLGLEGPAWRTPAAYPGESAELLEASREQGLEGVIAKRSDSPYEPGRRGGAWLKVKNSRRQELVIGGWMPGEGRRSDQIGALLLGYHDSASDATLRYAGRVGTGFGEAELRRLRALLEPDRRPLSPFAPDPPAPRAAMWVEPRRVAEVEFVEWTAQGMLRHPSYKGLRDDRDPAEVVREEPGPAPARPASAAGRARGGLTRAAVSEHYSYVADVLLPHLAGRAVALAPAPSDPGAEPLRIEDEGALARAVQAGALELSADLALAEDPSRPTALVLALAPGPGADLAAAARLALLLRGMLRGLDLQSLARTSGVGGLWVYVPLNSGATEAAAAGFAGAVAETLAASEPELATISGARPWRRGRVLIEASPGGAGGTLPAPYSLRAGRRGGVSTPLAWLELEQVVGGGDPAALAFTPAQVHTRVEQQGDMFAPVLSERQELPDL